MGWHKVVVMLDVGRWVTVVVRDGGRWRGGACRWWSRPLHHGPWMVVMMWWLVVESGSRCHKGGGYSGDNESIVCINIVRKSIKKKHTSHLRLEPLLSGTSRGCSWALGRRRSSSLYLTIYCRHLHHLVYHRLPHLVVVLVRLGRVWCWESMWGWSFLSLVIVGASMVEVAATWRWCWESLTLLVVVMAIREAVNKIIIYH